MVAMGSDTWTASADAQSATWRGCLGHGLGHEPSASMKRWTHCTGMRRMALSVVVMEAGASAASGPKGMIVRDITCRGCDHGGPRLGYTCQAYLPYGYTIFVHPIVYRTVYHMVHGGVEPCTLAFARAAMASASAPHLPNIQPQPPVA